MKNQVHCFLIDNDEDDREIFETALREVDETVICTSASNGIEGINRLKTDANFFPTFIFIDMNMPMMNGKECLNEIKKLPRIADIPVYIYSTASDPNSIEDIKKLGAEDFIIKPPSFRELKQVLFKIIERQNSVS